MKTDKLKIIEVKKNDLTNTKKELKYFCNTFEILQNPLNEVLMKL